MSVFAWMRERKASVAGASVVVAGSIVLAGFAVAYEGNPTAEVELDDGSVWVTKSSSEVMGHLNTESALLDGQLRGATSSEIGILQSGENVLLHDRRDNTLSRVDGAAMVLGERVSLEAGSAVEEGGGTLAILAPSTGGLFIMPTTDMGAFSVEESEPTLELPADAVVTVGGNGAVHAASAEERTLYTIETAADGLPEGEPIESPLESVDPGDELQITTVGDQAVILDQTSGYVVTAGGLETSVGAAGEARIAEDAAAGPSVRVATTSSLVSVPLDGSEASAVPAGAEGEPQSPVVVDGCVYGVWRGSGQVLRDCAGADRDLAQPLENAPGDAPLVLRARGGQVVVNDLAGGKSWLASTTMQLVDNWDDLTPPEGDDQESDEVEQTEVTEITPPDRTKDNRPPEAHDDEYGVRPGRSVVLPVLDNDNDPDGDLLTISIEDQPAIGRVETIQEGKAVQVTLAANETSGEGTFTYRVDDGRGLSDSARVTFAVHPHEENQAPAQKDQRPTVAVETGGSVTYNVLPDWIDPDGDDIYLAGVTPAEGDEATFTPDGQITYHARSGHQGPLDVSVTVSDGEAESTGELALDVRPVGTVRPVTNTDHLVIDEGATGTVEPLANDLNAASEELTLGGVTQVSGLEISANAQTNSLEVTGLVAGTYYVDYTATAGTQSAAGLIRVDVRENAEVSDEPPVAVRDTAYLPGGGEVLIDVLQNDVDPAGGVLVVQSVQTPSGAGVSAAVLGHASVRITDRAMLAEQIVLTYRVHNGQKGATGEIVVIPVPPSDKIQPPVTEDDTAVVRAGDVVTIPVTDNDHHPNGESFSVVPELVEAPAAKLGEAFVSQDTVRFRAAEDARGQATAIYEIVDDKGQKSAGLIRINITPWNEDNNAAPDPVSVTARALAGTDTRIEIPLEGIDPDGDMVDLVGISSAPSQGRVTETGPDYFTYEAYRNAAGADSFQYRVADTFGEESIATVTIGIAPPEGVNQPPNAMTDEIATRPGRAVSVPVLANDSDPDGDKFGLVPDGIEFHTDDPEFAAEVSGDCVIVTAPNRELVSQFEYTIEDEVGNTSRGVVQVTVAEDVPLEAPIARDDRVLIGMVTGDFTADVDLFANDEDPDGTTDALTVEVAGVEPLPEEGPGFVRVAVEDRRQTIPYTVTDPDGQTASAFLIVPAKDDLRPVLAEGAAITAPSNELIEIPLSEYVTVAEGLDVRITNSDAVSVNHGDGTNLVKDETTLQYRSEYRYQGSDDITFEVTDGDGPDDPNGRKSVITIPITVLTPENEPPEFTNTTMSVGAGDGPVSIDLSARTFDIDEDDIAYTHTNGAPDGVSVSISGSTLTVEASPDTRGVAASLAIAVSDGENDPVQGTVDLSVTASARSLPVANDEDLGEIHQGEPQQVGVLANDFNPFEGEGSLRVIDAVVEAGDGSVSYDDSSVTVTPGGDFHGYLTVRYTIADLTDDPDRYVQGRITGTVLGVPDAPGTPDPSEVGNREATLSWTAPSNNGAEISAYEVRATDGSFEQTCGSTVCRLTGLVNNKEYQFQVTAVNEVGPSAASAQSIVVRPDVKPEAPEAPQFTLTAGERDQRLGISWNQPNSDGSPVSGYLVRINDGSSVTTHRFANSTATSRVFDGLENGRQYRFQVAAMNRADVRSDDGWAWSPWSASEKPATVPSAPEAPTVSRESRSYGVNEFALSWPTLADNGGDSVDTWVVNFIQNGSVVRTEEFANAGNRVVVTAQTSSTDYQFTVAGENREGRGKASARSAAIRSYSEPGAPSDVALRAGDGALTISWTKADPNGVRDSEVGYEYRLNGGPWQPFSGVSSSGDRREATVSASNGTWYEARVRAFTRVNDDEGALYGAESAPSGTAKPYGPLAQPTITIDGTAGARIVRVDAYGNGYPLQEVRIRMSLDGDTVFEETVGPNSGDHLVGWTQKILVAPGQQLTVDVTARDEARTQIGKPTQEASSSASFVGPTPQFYIRNGGGNITLTYRDVTGSGETGLDWQRSPGTYVYACEIQRNGSWRTIEWNQRVDLTTAGATAADAPTDCFAGRYDNPARFTINDHDFVPGGAVSDQITLPAQPAE
ncbi:Ig-like domain-containing protein [Microbacterium sp. ZXX196]|uniref:Ig-like domain-containing protein n=1 Tax=Microbacterium sp. ZXX196 TaxID=2609291 RepID=UPI0012BA185F|nr:Ig-like domain-containing protein [Microbacterium sp. ZXX196]MTE23978.1 tandem-95 repeat protein [Microbacterium sp. ZXX196]